MRLPDTLQAALEGLIADIAQDSLAKSARHITERYRSDAPPGDTRAVSTDEQALAYAAARMPATYAAAYAALSHAAEGLSIGPESLLDAGAGPGTAAWAACALFPSIKKVTLIEPEMAMRAAGQAILSRADSPPQALSNAQWIGDDMQTAIFPQADLVIASYSINELPRSERISAAEKLFAASGKMLVLIEPGTPDGYERLLSIRDALLSQGAFQAAPCPHGNPCPLPKGDWCHFPVRVERSRLHKRLKGGDAPFEDEKYCYMAFLREKPTNAPGARILRHPLIRPGNITLSLCTPQSLCAATISRKQKESFRIARKSSAGDRYE